MSLTHETETEPSDGRAADGADASSGRIAVEKHPRATRWMHWINFPLMLVMVWSGIRIYTANDVYSITVFGTTIFDFWPEWFTGPLELDRRLAKGIAYHLTFGWLFAINGALFGMYLWRSGEWRHVWPTRRALRDAGKVVLHDLHLRRQAPEQVGKYNAAQQLSYGFVIALGGIIVLTGFAIYKPAQLSPLTAAFGGYQSARVIHFMTTLAFMAFFVVHVLQVLRAGWGNFASMVTGFELQPKSSSRQATAEREEVDS